MGLVVRMRGCCRRRTLPLVVRKGEHACVSVERGDIGTAEFGTGPSAGLTSQPLRGLPNGKLSTVQRAPRCPRYEGDGSVCRFLSEGRLLGGGMQ
jgi:hypothetical protein